MAKRREEMIARSRKLEEIGPENNKVFMRLLTFGVNLGDTVEQKDEDGNVVAYNSVLHTHVRVSGLPVPATRDFPCVVPHEYKDGKVVHDLNAELDVLQAAVTECIDSFRPTVEPAVLEECGACGQMVTPIIPQAGRWRNKKQCPACRKLMVVEVENDG